jgi:hypothetical protein
MGESKRSRARLEGFKENKGVGFFALPYKRPFKGKKISLPVVRISVEEGRVAIRTF